MKDSKSAGDLDRGFDVFGGGAWNGVREVGSGVRSGAQRASVTGPTARSIVRREPTIFCRFD